MYGQPPKPTRTDTPFPNTTLFRSRHPIKLIANALGVPPQYMIDRAKAEGVPIAALVGAKEHALKQVHAGVDVIIAQGTEAGGHCGEVTTMVLVPEVVEALRAAGSSAPVLAAGEIGRAHV